MARIPMTSGFVLIPEGEYVIGEFGNTDFSVLNSVDFLSGNNLPRFPRDQP